MCSVSRVTKIADNFLDFAIDLRAAYPEGQSWVVGEKFLEIQSLNHFQIIHNSRGVTGCLPVLYPIRPIPSPKMPAVSCKYKTIEDSPTFSNHEWRSQVH